ncbi:MAG: Rrf2 family transcriptional regulator [Ignavibacteria bacterium]|nr:Rrf2 family transcriptional regulator [Ignavibacteria bacterium]
MSVIFSKACEYGLQAILYLASKPENECVPANEISKNLKIPKEFVSKILQSLVSYKIVSSKKGKFGGFSLAKPTNAIKLIDIVEAIDGLSAFSSCVIGFPKCSSDVPCPVHDDWGKLRTLAYEMLSKETIDNFTEKTLMKIKHI